MHRMSKALGLLKPARQLEKRSFGIFLKSRIPKVSMSNIYKTISETDLRNLFSLTMLDRVKKALEQAQESKQCLNYYECGECHEFWYDVYDCVVEMDCPSCGLRHIVPLETSRLLKCTVS